MFKNEVWGVTPEHTTLILATADAIFASGRFADCFYDRLFAIAPQTRLLFGADLTVLKLKFMNTLSILVGSIQHPEIFASIVTHLGGQHSRFGVLAAHYEAAGKALQSTLGDILGERFTPEVHDAWALLYTEIVEQMQAGARAG